MRQRDHLDINSSVWKEKRRKTAQNTKYLIWQNMSGEKIDLSFSFHCLLGKRIVQVLPMKAKQPPTNRRKTNSPECVVEWKRVHFKKCVCRFVYHFFGWEINKLNRKQTSPELNSYSCRRSAFPSFCDSIPSVWALLLIIGESKQIARHKFTICSNKPRHREKIFFCPFFGANLEKSTNLSVHIRVPKWLNAKGNRQIKNIVRIKVRSSNWRERSFHWTALMCTSSASEWAKIMERSLAVDCVHRNKEKHRLSIFLDLELLWRDIRPSDVCSERWKW